MKEARIEISTKCNYKCVMCPHSTGAFKRNYEVMPNDLYILILDKIKKAGYKHITLSGFGEPFTDPDINYKIKIAREKDFKVHILTNGSYLDNETLDFLKQSGIEDLRISFYAISASTYREITKSRREMFYNVFGNIISAKSKGIKVIVTYNEIPENEHETMLFIHEMKNKVDTLEVWYAHNWADWGDYKKDIKLEISCGRPFSDILQIQVDGTVNMCCFDYNGILLIGDLKTQSVDEIFNSKEIKEIREAHKTGIFPKEWPCYNCDQRMKNKENEVIYNSQYTPEERVKITSTARESIWNEKVEF